MFGNDRCFCNDNFFIILLLLLCNDGFDCGQGCGFDDNNKCFVFIIIILLFCCNKKGHGNCLI
ncbi:hypothetical protein [Romboutsia sp. 1001713B170131_170501_G6]|uniref:hypothetical protein n=1 Tax=Romboutsia sp. 1001713B170131_170501_G6 TaxID=2787108 RepID=UPI0018A9DF18|nr:hypothetical protein [Romboutsia sp. 1001713B170131_170501_G6]